MEDKYIREDKIIEKTEEQKRQEIIISILKVKQELDEANRNYEYAEDDLIDYYSYKIKANCSKMDYLLKKAKEYGIAMDMIKQLEIRFYDAI